MTSTHLCRLALVALLVICAGAARSEGQANRAATGAATTTTTATTTRPTQGAATTRPIGLPDAWFGTWHGPTQIMLASGEAAGHFTMSLEIALAPGQPAGALPVYAWAITYEMEGKKQVRPYLLRVVTDAAGQGQPGHFVLDETNGILVDQFLVGRTMQGHFVVEAGGRRAVLNARYELGQDDAGRPAITVEIATYDGNEARRSGAAQNGVESRRLLRVQRAVLTKQ